MGRPRKFGIGAGLRGLGRNIRRGTATSSHRRKARNVLHGGRGRGLFRTKTVPNAVRIPGSSHAREFSLTSLSHVVPSFVAQGHTM
jgi:hypothetical protein